MKARRAIWSMSLAAAVVIGCGDASPLVPQTDLMVVQGYLFAGEPVTGIRITEDLPLDADTDEPMPIEDAQVWLVEDGQQYELAPSPGSPGYYWYPGVDLQVEAGDEFELRVGRGDLLVTAHTVVPEPPRGVVLSTTEMLIDESAFPSRPRFGEEGGDGGVTLSWDNEEGDYHYAVVECVEEEPEAVAWAFVGVFGGVPGEGARRFTTPPITQNTYTVQSMQIGYYGRHRARVFRVNEEYVDLFKFGEQDPARLSEPPTNIEHGLGIFTAFNSVSLEFRVSRAPAE